MPQVFLSLGSNVGNRRQNLEQALSALAVLGILQASTVFETPALLTADAEPEWQKPFLNMACRLEFAGTPRELLAATQSIELAFGRVRNRRWQPRLIDIDILHWPGVESEEPDLILPHPQLFKRAFVLDPLAELDPTLVIAGQSVLQMARARSQHQPRLMGILNLSPDSFSHSEKRYVEEEIETTLEKWSELPISIIDIGGESTRPGAVAVDPSEEWPRVQSAIKKILSLNAKKLLRPKISLDTRHFQVAALAIDAGVDMINDVSGLSTQGMLEIAKKSDCEFVLMHSVTVPADPKFMISQNEPAPKQLCQWFEKQMLHLEDQGIARTRLYLDPGIGFGKNSMQSLDLLKQLSLLQSLSRPLVVGHSRKSLISTFSQAAAPDRDIETVGLSLALAAKGADVIRVHEPEMHHRALLAWSHLR